jgi:hypothetical protein
MAQIEKEALGAPLGSSEQHRVAQISARSSSRYFRMGRDLDQTKIGAGTPGEATEPGSGRTKHGKLGPVRNGVYLSGVRMRSLSDGRVRVAAPPGVRLAARPLKIGM